MSSLNPSDFTPDQAESIEARLKYADDDISRLTSSVATAGNKYDKVVYLDEANQKVQEAAVDDVVTILHAIAVARDIAFPAAAPHFFVFNPPPAPHPSFPVAAPDLSAATVLATYLAALPSYSVPFLEASLEAWVLWRTVLLTPQVDPSQPSTIELTPAYDVAVEEFSDRNEDRLHSDIGSFVMKSFVYNQIAVDTGLISLLERRRTFWEGLGFSGG